MLRRTLPRIRLGDYLSRCTLIIVLACLLGGLQPRRVTAADVTYLIHMPLLMSNPSTQDSQLDQAEAEAAKRRTYLFGTLLTDGLHNQQEYAAGLRVAEMELGWDAYEPRDGIFSDPNEPGSYAYRQRLKLHSLRAAGFKVVLGIGLQYPPSWAFTYPNSRYVNQYGDQAGSLNLTFNQTLRLRAEKYIARVHADLGLNNFWAVRIGAGGNVEALYPGMSYGSHINSYWAFDANAQSGVDLPPTIAAQPFPGWVPSQRAWNSTPFSIAQVQRWYDWYLGALVDGVNWQIRAYKHQGYTGYLQVLMPGLGSRPSEYTRAIANYLDGTGDSNRTMGRGAAWHKVIEQIADKENVVAYVSSLADGSGTNDLCQADDTSLGLNDSRLNTWSAARWISYNADRFGLAKMGENPGRRDTENYGPAMLSDAVAQMKACGFQGLMWAHQFNLYDGVSGITLDDITAAIREANGAK